MKKIVMILSVLLLTGVLLFGLGAGDEKPTVAVVLKTLSSEYWNYVKAGCEQAAKDLGIRVVVVGPGAESEIAGQVTMIEEQLAQDIIAIVCAPNDGDAASAALSKAKVPVLFVDTDGSLPTKTAFVGTGNEDAASLGGNYIASKDPNAKAVIIYGQEGDATSNARRNGYKKALQAAGIKILAEQSGNNTTDGAKTTMEDLLNRFPNQITAVLSHNDDTAIGAMNAIKDSGAKGIKIIGFDGNASAIDLILTGNLEGTVAQQPFQMGYTAVQKAVLAANGEKVDKYIPVPALLVTKENAKKYLDDLKKIIKK
ncbi:MAG: sugar ABC transporter substrate-binding protein [Treponemataceae bacterium]